MPLDENQQSEDFVIEYKVMDEVIQKSANTLINKLYYKKNLNDKFNNIVYQLLVSNFENYKTVSYLTRGDKKFTAQAYIINRSILDSVFNAILICCNLETYPEKFILSGFRDQRKALNTLREKYGHIGKWKRYIKDYENFLNAYIEEFDIDIDYSQDHMAIKPWPRLKEVIDNRRKFGLSNSASAIFSDLYELEYPKLSQWSHQHWTGLAMGVSTSKPEGHEDPGRYESIALLDSAIYFTIILSEVESKLNFGIKKDLQYEWVILGEGHDRAKEYYEIRYKGLLS